MKTKLIILTLLACSLTTFGQVTAPKSLDVFLEIVPSNSTALTVDLLDSLNTSYSNQVVNIKAIVGLQDTVNIYKVHIKIGTTSGASDIVDTSFLLDEYQTLPQGFIYKLRNKTLYLTLGQHTGINDYYGEVKLESYSGQFSFPISYSSLD